MKNLILILVVFLSIPAKAQESIEWTPLMQQTSLYFTSDQVTQAGIGLGGGIRLAIKNNYIAQTDVNVLWINGNAVSNRFALGYQRTGRWTPAVLGTMNVLWGHRTEILSENGERPKIPICVAGLRIDPFRFNTAAGSISMFELGYGLGPDKGRLYELCILSIQARW